MAEPEGGESLETATQPRQDGIETVGAEAQPEIQPEEFTVEELAKLVNKAVRGDLNAHWQGLEGRFQGLEMQAKDTREALKSLDVVRQYSEKLLASTLAPEELDAMKRDADVQALKEHLAKAENERKAWQDVAVKTVEQQDRKDYDAIEARLEAYAKSQGLASTTHLTFPSQRIPTPNDPRGWHQWEEDAKGIIDADVDRLAKAAQPQARIITQRPAGDTGERIQSLVNKAGAGEDLSPAETAQVAKALNEGYVVKRR